MRSKRISYVLIFLALFSLFLIPEFSEACVTLSSFKTNFLPGETMQVEINVEPGKTLSRDIYSSDLFLYNLQNSLIGGNFFIIKVSNQKYFAWFDVPSVGDYILKVRAICGNNFFAQTNLKVNQPKSDYYNFLKSKVVDKWLSLSLEENIFAGAALSYNESLNQKALEAYYSRKDSCINTNCSTKNAALSMMAFRDFSTKAQLKNLLESYQNSVKGNWRLEINSSIAQDCNLTIENSSRILNLFPNVNAIDLDFSDYLNSQNVLIKDNCENISSRKLIFIYNELTKNFNMANNFVLQNTGCFGTNFKNNCDQDSTAYALFALKLSGIDIVNQDNAVKWLSENADSIEQIAILYYLNKDSARLNQVLSSQNYNGAWQKNGISDIRASVLIYYILNGIENKTGNVDEAIKKAHNYLENALKDSNLVEKSYLLYFIFPNIEPSMGIWPGLVKVKSENTFNLILQNKGSETIDVSITFLNSSNSFEISRNSMKNLEINVPKIETINGEAISEQLMINYQIKTINSEVKSYSVPVVIFTLKGNVNYFGNYTINQSPINPEQQQGIINGTFNNPTTNQTANLSKSLIKQNFYFNFSNFSYNFLNSETATISFRLINKFSKTISDIELRKSASMQNLVVQPSSISELSANEEKTIIIYADPDGIGLDTFGKKVEGILNAIGEYDGQEVKTAVTLNFNSSIQTNSNTCAEMYGKDCSVYGKICKNNNVSKSSDIKYCCLTECIAENKNSSNGKIIAVVIIIFVILILIGVFLYLKKKPKKEMKDFLEEVSKDKQPTYTEDFQGVKSKDFKEEFSDEDFEKFK